MATSRHLSNKRNILTILSGKMSKQINNSSSSINLSADSLEELSIKHGVSEENVDTILVPFYEKDVLVKVSKDKNKKRHNRQGRSHERMKAEAPNSSYLVNKHKARRSSYLEMFRKQKTPQKSDKKLDQHEIRSLSPEVGDTERDSINEDSNNPQTDFYNTEAYNEIYYEKLLTQDYDNYVNNYFEEKGYAEDGDEMDTSPHDLLIDNLRSVSEVSQPRRHVRRATVDPPLDNVKLGGLGPDMERIKPRLDRARSLQRYSEKVRMENRLKIYKKTVQVEKDAKAERETIKSKRHQEPKKAKEKAPEKEITTQKEDSTVSYLMNKSNQPKSSQLLNKIYSKSKSADAKKNRETIAQNMSPNDKTNTNAKHRIDDNNISERDKKLPSSAGTNQGRVKSSTRNKGMNTEKGIPPVHINFMVNVGGVRPSSALKTLEEKHRMYQEQVKAFKMENND